MNYRDLTKRYARYFRNKINGRNVPFKIITGDEQMTSFLKSYKRKLTHAKSPREWANLGIVASDPYMLVVRDLVQFPRKRIGPYTRILSQAGLSGGQAVVILAELDGKIVVLNQFRHATRSWHLEIPRGSGESNLKAEENAKKEIREEINAKVDSLVELGEYHSNTGLEAESVRLFYARIDSPLKPNDQEGIKEIILLTPQEFSDYIREGKITDGFSIAAFFRARLRGLI
jgi:ADP-ribose pyrophosphatase